MLHHLSYANGASPWFVKLKFKKEKNEVQKNEFKRRAGSDAWGKVNGKERIKERKKEREKERKKERKI